MTGLSTMLGRLETAWLSLGMPSTGWLRPGLDPGETVRRLRRAGLAAPSEILEWFAWHEGAQGLKSTEGFWTILGPSGYHPLTIDQALEERRVGLQLRRELIDVDGFPEEEVVDWPVTWLPIGRNVSGTVMAVDLGAAAVGQVPIFVIDWHDWETFEAPCAPSLASIVTTWLEVLENYSEWVGGAETWRVRFAEVPVAVRGIL
jgi:hypothetical protein